jgi:hypothetical protein
MGKIENNPIFNNPPHQKPVMKAIQNGTVAISIFGAATKIEGKTATIIRTGLFLLSLILLFNYFKKPNLTITVG